MFRHLIGACLGVVMCACGAQHSTNTERRCIEELPRERLLILTDSTINCAVSDTLRFGQMHSGEIAELKLWVGNRTSRPIVLADYERSCGCTTLEFDSYPILPGEAEQVVCTFDSRGEYGWQFKRMDVTLSGVSQRWTIYVEAVVK